MQDGQGAEIVRFG